MNEVQRNRPIVAAYWKYPDSLMIRLQRRRQRRVLSEAFAIDYVADILDEDVDLLREIISNDDNLTYGNIISVVTADEESTPALTDDGIDELKQMLAEARRSAKIWQEFLDSLFLDEEIAARVKTYSPRQQPGGYHETGV